MKRILVSLALGGSLAAASLAPAVAQGIPAGSYQQSCSGIHTRDGQLIARCSSTQGAQVRTSIALSSCRGGDIANSNGQLVCNGGNGYRRNNGYNGGGYNNGGYNNGNNGGYSGGNGYRPGGSYQQSCQNVRSNGGMLTATCPDGRGNMMTTSIDARGCRGTDIANRNGRLAC